MPAPQELPLATVAHWSDVPCKVWTKARCGTKGGRVAGYGVRGVPGTKRNVMVHRAALAEKLGRPIASGLCACHHCDNSLCYEPAHLFEGTYQQNNDDMKEKGRRYTMPRQTHCSRNHPLSGDNLYLWKNTRQCRKCKNITMRNLREAKQCSL